MLGPVQPADARQDVQGVAVHVQDGGVVEQAAVEVRDLVDAEGAARRPWPGKAGPAAGGTAAGRRRACATRRVKMPFGSRSTSSANRQNRMRIRKWAAAMRLGAPLAQDLGQPPELDGGLLGDLLGGLRRRAARPGW